MRAFVVNRYAPYNEIPLDYDAPEPTPCPNDVLVDVYSAALNFFDVCLLCVLKQLQLFTESIVISNIDFTNPRKVPKETTISFCVGN
jgi:hypothetical protein